LCSKRVFAFVKEFNVNFFKDQGVIGEKQGPNFYRRILFTNFFNHVS